MPKNLAKIKASKPDRIVFCTSGYIVHWDYDAQFMADARSLGYPAFAYGSTVYVYGIPNHGVRS